MNVAYPEIEEQSLDIAISNFTSALPRRRTLYSWSKRPATKFNEF